MPKLIGRFSLGALMAASMVMVSSTAVAAKTIKIANFFPDSHPVNVSLKEVFKPVVEKESDGELKVKIYSNSTLGGEERLYNSVRGGTIEMAVIGNIMEKEVDYVSIVQKPFLFANYRHAHDVLRGPIGDKLVADFSEKLGLHFLGWGVQGFRVIASNKPIHQMEDFQGMRLRFPGIENMVEIGQSLGANVTPLPINEVFGALEQGVVDGVENPYANLYASKWYELTKYILESNHVFTPNMYVINEEFWSRLSAQEQKILQDAVTQSTEKEWQLLISDEDNIKRKLAESGVEITAASPELHAKMQDSVQNSYAKLYSQQPGAEEIVEEIKRAPR